MSDDPCHGVRLQKLDLSESGQVVMVEHRGSDDVWLTSVKLTLDQEHRFQIICRLDDTFRVFQEIKALPCLRTQLWY